jgi:hypothetical protein
MKFELPLDGTYPRQVSHGGGVSAVRTKALSLVEASVARSLQLYLT